MKLIGYIWIRFKFSQYISLFNLKFKISHGFLDEYYKSDLVLQRTKFYKNNFNMYFKNISLDLGVSLVQSYIQ